MSDSLPPLGFRSIDPAFSKAFRESAGADCRMSFARFMELALYHPELGYYRRERERIGYATGTDFFTASNSSLFAELVIEACRTLVAPRAFGEFTWIEIGAESPRGILGDRHHPFRATKALRLGEALELTGSSIVFSNELFDAQPFRRLVFQNSAWREMGVALNSEGLSEVILEKGEFPAVLPTVASEGYRIDLPMAAVELAKRIAAQPWTGLFVAFDYGLSWAELTESRPGGTARAYFRHSQSNDLLARPGEQDLTCHVCWDFLQEVLRLHGFGSPVLESQEAFFVRNASESIAKTMAAEASHLSQRKLSLLQLLHPTHLGQKFQVLWAKRDVAPPG